MKRIGEGKKSKICGRKNLGNYWHLKNKCYIGHKMENIAVKYPKKSSNHSSFSSNKKKLCSTQKIINRYPVSKTKVDYVLISCLIQSFPQNLITSVIIDSSFKDHFFSN